MINHELIIIGGGASGLAAAVTAKDLGIDVAIVEGTDRIGKKILTTGNGRCNISNRGVIAPFINYHSENKNFFSDVLNTYSVYDVENFFLSLGLPLVELKNKKLYPKSLQASSVVDIFRLAIEDRGIPLYTDCKVRDIHKDKNFILSTSNEEKKLFTCEKVILACGGKSAVKTGSDGSGYNLAKSFGHTMIQTTPGIVQLKLDSPFLKALSGIKFDGYATLIVNGEEKRKEFGEILFTDYGISGPPILQISGGASKALLKHKDVEILVDMNPNSTKKEITDFIEGHFAVLSHRPVIDALIGVVNKKLIPTLLKEANIQNLHSPCYDLDWKQKKALVELLKEWKFKCIDTNGFNQAQVTIGGIDTKDIEKSTLESKLCEGLYFCGEIMDVNGDCGGYNLNWAWCSGQFAANSAAKNLNK